MHADVRPWLPFSAENSLLYSVSDGWLYLFCLILGVAGVMALLVIFIWNKIAIEI
jgi:hypothetical protein